MKDKQLLPTKSLSSLYLVLLLILSGCAGPKIAPDLLSNTKTYNKPLVENSSLINVKINPRINNYEKLDESVKQSLEIALANANIFGASPSSPYRIDANILVASQAAMSFGSFKGKLEIRYLVRDSNNKEILDKSIFTVAGSDKMFFSGAKRHRRARAVNISKNVLQFVEALQTLLEIESGMGN